ncbi:MAG: WbqC family protein [Bacteroidaceae bacterium]|nr:WbqC family protein [Bacteroidaceae bacterium]
MLQSYYLPPISWFAGMLDSGEPIVYDMEGNYKKQTLHNRCWIDAPNGKLALTVPVDRSTFVGGKCRMKDVKVSEHADWQRQHWYALESSYYNSAYFEYLQDDFRPVYETKWKWLADLNERLVNVCLDVMDLRTMMPFASTQLNDRKWDCELPYYQVFARKHGFQPNLSIIDLIFNMGPESVLYLTQNGQEKCNSRAN